jgi:hypothetical protein
MVMVGRHFIMQHRMKTHFLSHLVSSILEYVCARISISFNLVFDRNGVRLGILVMSIL